MINKYNLWYQLKIITIALISISLLAFLWVYIYDNANRQKQVLVQNWVTLQNNAIERIAFDAGSYNVENFEQFMITQVIPKLKYTEASYGFFYGDGRVIYENNNAFTRIYQGQTIRDTYGAYSYNGGTHLLEVLTPMEYGISGNDYFVKEYAKGKEYVTWTAITKGGVKYILGIATPEKYILEQYNFLSIQNDVNAFAGVYSFILFLFAGMLCFMTYRYNHMIETMDKEDKRKEEMIISMSTQDRELEEKFKDLTIKDLLTGIYNRKFFDVFLTKMEASIFLPLSIGLMDINGLKLINNAFGYEKGDETLRRVVDACQAFCSEDDLLARYGNDEFIILMINTENDDAHKKLKEISKQVEEAYQGVMPVSISYGVATKQTDDEAVYDIILEAENRLNIDKLNVADSVRSGSVSMLKKILEEKTAETEEHCERIRHYACMLASAIGMDDKKIQELGLLAYLHDVGKIVIPDDILNKEGQLSEEEMEIMHSHPELGYNIAMASPDLKVIAKYILQHHENWDGTGYPKQLAGEKITLEARIISIVDAFDAMINKRVYKGASTIEEALVEIGVCSGTQFDPNLARVFIETVKKSIA